MRQFNKFLAVAVVALLSAGRTAEAGTPDPAADAAGVVTAFSAAISNQKLDIALSYLASGGVQFGLRPSHSGMGNQPAQLTSDLRAHWSMIGPVLFAATKSYARKAEIIHSHADGDLATVWARIETTSQPVDKAETRTDRFVELLLAMSYNNPEIRPLLDLENLKQ